jgi:hypothetical protein
VLSFTVEDVRADVYRANGRLDVVTSPSDGYSKAIADSIKELRTSVEAGSAKLAAEIQKQADESRRQGEILNGIRENTAATVASVNQLSKDLEDARSDIRQIRDQQVLFLRRSELASPVVTGYRVNLSAKRVAELLEGTGIKANEVLPTRANGSLAFIPVPKYENTVSSRFIAAGWQAIPVRTSGTDVDTGWYKPIR